jgi:phage replication initiation protein
MTRPSQSSLVLDGSEIKIRLEAERAATQSPVHVDWLRFTVLRRNNPTPSVETLFPAPASNVWDESTRTQALSKAIAVVPDCDFDASAQAHELAYEVCEVLGPDFTVACEVRKGHDFYKFRWSIERQGVECGWVGFLSSGDSPRQQAQSKTIHVNLYGHACTFAQTGWNLALADLVDARKGDITRADLALDFFDGLEGGIDGILAQYKAGDCDSSGKRLKCNMLGDWANGQERSIYFGSKEAGKQTNCYEKGDQLFGPEAGNKWLRVELRYGNKLRVLPSDILRRPSDFFAGASDWHALTLAKADHITAPSPIKTQGRLALETVEAEVTRNLRWALNTAAPTMAALFQNLGDEFLHFVSGTKLPGRISKFKPSEVRAAFASAINRFPVVGGVGHASACTA